LNSTGSGARPQTRAELDAAVWAILLSRTAAGPRPAASTRPGNYAEIGEQLRHGREFSLVWGDFLHEFYLYREAYFFTERPPDVLAPGWKAFMAGAAEFLCLTFSIQAPDWIEEPRYFLQEVWDMQEHAFPFPDLGEFREMRLARSPHAWARRKVICQARDLTTL
jgi:hypothetical protein